MKALILLLTLLSSVHHSLLVNAAEAPDEIVARGNKDLDRPVPYKDLLSEQEGEDTFSSNTTSTSWTPGLPDGRPEPTEEQHHDENLDFIAISRNSYPNWRWTNRENGIATIPYYIRQSKYNQEYGFDQSEYDKILDALAHITSETNKAVQFRWWTSSDDSYILFKKSSGGCSSWIGQQSGYQDIWLASWCIKRGTIQHETLHALGFGHEMNRPDRDNYVTIKFGNIKPDWFSQFEKSSSANSLGTLYDYYSVMHYHAYAASKNGGLTIDAGAYTDIIGQRNGISEGDILQLKLIYQCTTGPRTYQAMRNDGLCTNQCQCFAGQVGCVGDDDRCRGSLVCDDNTCKEDGTSITSSHKYYLSGASIELSFQNPGNNRAWISIQPSDADPHDITSSSEAWSWVCGSKSCSNQSLSSGTLTVPSVSNGTWRAFLILDMYSPYESVAYTDTFVVSDAMPMITSSKQHYLSGASIELSFQNPGNNRAWISIQPSDADPHDITSSSEAWSWVCGSKSCSNQSLSSGTLTVPSVSNGTWRAFLIWDLDHPYESVAYTDEFVVSDTVPGFNHILYTNKIKIRRGSSTNGNIDIAFLKESNDSKSITFIPPSSRTLLVNVFVKVPSLLNLSTVSKLRFEAFVKAPPTSTNVFRFQIRNFNTRKWQLLDLSKNKTPFEFNSWTKELSLGNSINISDYTNKWGKMLVRLISKNKNGEIEVDSLAWTLSG